MSSNYEHEHHHHDHDHGHDHHGHDHHDRDHHDRDHHDRDHHDRDHHDRDHHDRDHHDRDHHGRDHHERESDRSLVDNIKNHLENINNTKNHDFKGHDQVISSDEKVDLGNLKSSDALKVGSLVFSSSDSGVQVSSGDGNDTVTTGSGNDSINAGSGDDSISSGAGNDTVDTGLGNDTVNTGSGNDSVLAGSGNDSVNTGYGNDIIKLAADYLGSSTIDGGSQQDTLDLIMNTILSVNQADNGNLVITLDNNSVIDVANVESFIYDDNGATAGGNVEIVGVAELISQFQQFI